MNKKTWEDPAASVSIQATHQDSHCLMVERSTTAIVVGMVLNCLHLVLLEFSTAFWGWWPLAVDMPSQNHLESKLYDMLRRKFINQAYFFVHVKVFDQIV